MRDDESVELAMLLTEARLASADPMARLRALLDTFERGLEVATTEPALAKPSRVRPGQFTWRASNSRQMLLHDAIDARRTVRFSYQGRIRIVEPHVLGTKDGRLQVLTRQVGGHSSSGGLPDWRRFFVDELYNPEMLPETFGVRPFWSRRRSSFDRYIAIARASR
jgi:hypothetical protein